MNLTVPELIGLKRDGHRLSDEAIAYLIDRYGRGELPDEQMSALAMAVYFRGLDDAETAAWTEAMLSSGEMLDFRDIGRPVVDKHSTGGVGDKVSLVLAPIAAACGLTVPMVSGRGLGHTGGTIDKLEAIPNFSADLSPGRFREVLRDVGAAIIGATKNIAPADKRLYALRDVTGTVPSIPLIVASIMSKKLAEGLDALVLDVKVGRAAFMPTLEAARELADRMIAVGLRMGVRTRAVLTRMEEPLGRMIGNACEVRESIDCLEGHGPAALTELCLAQAAEMVALGKGLDANSARGEVEHAWRSGAAREVFAKMVKAQGGDLEALPEARAEVVLRAGADGYVGAIDGLAIAQALVRLGAGRKVASDTIDPRIGLRIDAEVGQSVCPGAPLATLFLGDRDAPEHELGTLRGAFTLSDDPVAATPLILEWR
jgi:pyrimidine-nucleoside phosphorylase